MIQSAAAANGLPAELFARVIWQESRFRPDTVGPVTRSGQRAQGIAQFMPGTAAERRLLDPFDPVQALPKSAGFLRDLLGEFGNFGLAAAAYNAGPQRVRDWLAGKRALPSETKAYVRNVTGRSAEEWIGSEPRAWQGAIPGDMPCPEIAQLTEKPRSATRLIGHKPAFDWSVQLIGDRSEPKALAAYHQLQKKHEAILGDYQPVVIRTALGGRGAASWHRVRVVASSRKVAEALCSKLRAAGGSCLVQRN